ncbi:hypothetical protein AgCh_020110 [Apium graveolens]
MSGDPSNVAVGSVLKMHGLEKKVVARATTKEAQCIKSCLNQYEKATGQQVNFQKSSIHFSSNTSDTIVQEDKLCQPKKLGGMGFRKIREFNVAMLGKQAWRLQTENQSLIAKLMQARYYPSGSFRDANIGGNPSFIWRSIFEAKQLIEAGSRVKVGNGELINIWLDPWVPASNNALVTTLAAGSREGRKREAGSQSSRGDEHGSFQAGYGGQIAGIVDPKITEAMAFQEALSWVKKRNQNKVIFKLDALVVVQAMKRRKVDDASYFGSIISYCVSLFKDLRSSNVCFVRRSANIAAHLISREASSVPDREE